MRVRTFNCPCDQIVINVKDWKGANEYTVKKGQKLKERAKNQLINQDEYYSEHDESEIEANHRFVGREFQRDDHRQNEHYGRRQTSPSISTHHYEECPPKASSDVAYARFEVDYRGGGLNPTR